MNNAQFYMLPMESCLPFLGERNYLQGTTLFDAITDFIPRETAVDYRISGVFRTDRILVTADKYQGETGALLVTGSGTNKQKLFVSPLESSDKPERILFDETPVQNQMCIEGDSVSITHEAEHSFATTIVSLNKWFLKGILPIEGTGQWMFTRLTAKYIPDEYSNIVLKKKAVFSNGALVCSEVIVLGELIGDLYFSWVS